MHGGIAVSLVEELRRKADPIWRRIFEHPFVVELYTGRLPEEKFKFYALQDYRYLVGLVKALTIIASKAEFQLAREVIKLAHAEVTTELESYEKLLERLGFTIKDAINVEPMPTNVAYTNFMVATAYEGTAWEGLTALLPCFWSYMEIASVHQDKLKENPVELYVDWASVYLSKEYIEVVEGLKQLLEGAPPSPRLEEIFATASRYEYMFWDASYRMERWPI